MENKYRTNSDGQINFHENYEVEYWAKQFNIRPATLREVIAKTGPSVNSIKKYLK